MIPENVKQPLDRSKLKALVHYICFQRYDPSVLGEAKLNISTP